MAWNKEFVSNLPANPGNKWQVQEPTQGVYQLVNTENPKQTIPIRPEQAIQFLSEQANKEIIHEVLK
jgi:hypothetical protein